MRILLAGLLLTQAAPAQSEADKLEAALKRFGDRTYKVREDGKDAGKFQLKTRLVKEKGRAEAVFEDRFECVFDNKKSSFASTETVALKGFRLVSVTASLREGDAKHHWSLVVEGNKARLTTDGLPPTSTDVPADLLGEMGVLRRVCWAEQKEGATFETVIFNLERDRLELGPVFRCLGLKKIDWGGKSIEALKWEEKGDLRFSTGDGSPGLLADAPRDNVYWVSPDGYLLRFTSGSLEMTLDAK